MVKIESSTAPGMPGAALDALDAFT